VNINMKISDLLSKDFEDFFITPIFQIDFNSGERNNRKKEILDEIINYKIKEAKEILLKNATTLLQLEIKKEIIEILKSKCPKNNVFPITTFKEILYYVCQYIVSNERSLTPEEINLLNDISLEYYANNFDIYSIKIYQKKGSLKKLIDNTEYLLEKYTGTIRNIGITYNGLGQDYHDIHVLKPIIKNEVYMIIYFNLNDPEYFQHNNVYIDFWGVGKKLWEEISLSSINRIAQFLQEFLEQPNLHIKNVNISNYIKRTSLPDKIVDIIESSNSRDISLKFDHIIDLDIQFNSNIYDEIRDEINGCYRKCYFAAMYILIRKLLENLLIDCLRNYYKEAHLNKYYDENNRRFLIFEILKKNFNSMIKENDFKQKIGIVQQNYIDILGKFKEIGNIHGHSLFSLNHQSIAEENKDKLNQLIKRLININYRLSSI